jgi:hypothetical protein
MVDNDKTFRHNRFVMDPDQASSEYGQQVVAAGFLLVVPLRYPIGWPIPACRRR